MKKNYLWLLPFYEKVRRKMRTTIVVLLKYFYSFSAAQLNNFESEDQVFAQEFSHKKSSYRKSDDEDIYSCIAGRLNNNYFALNESSSLC